LFRRPALAKAIMPPDQPVWALIRDDGGVHRMPPLLLYLDIGIRTVRRLAGGSTYLACNAVPAAEFALTRPGAYEFQSIPGSRRISGIRAPGWRAAARKNKNNTRIPKDFGYTRAGLAGGGAQE
jgi:hypothetical protein